MKLSDLYTRAVKRGLAVDPRTKEQIRAYLSSRKKEFGKLRGVERSNFDTESLRHPFADTRILHGDPDTEITSMMVGIDADIGELLIADAMNKRGERVDLVVSHHPSGRALAGLHQVMSVQLDILEGLGIARKIGEELLKERMSEVERRILPSNLTRTTDAARLLDVPFMCIHTPADNHVVRYLEGLFKKERPGKIADLLTLLTKIPEYSDAIRHGAGPRLLTGDKKNKPGRIFVDMTGGTEGPKNIFARLSQAGVGTMVVMHLSEEHFKSVKPEHINVIIAGHIASDNLGLNLLLDSVLRNEDVAVIPCSGFVRVKR